ncbi:Guanine-nucleotide dissociation stimulator CDC25 [Penicillium cinerascens]|uniref:Guanine-nucleotide dissociation stimulator CDC25 n=1 Tax=Penicillium cinerascens TaxID=70096 RepID=A0A9W9N8I7_9EURO|nr:Guanine-nucleotide dissociation stimulator CDC25 [Penicillium cinerascens]KAJ5215217.1 Guanine-nucleotide dissociation stimulator CDC25 [Penicillium cinerascens]
MSLIAVNRYVTNFATKSFYETRTSHTNLSRDMDIINDCVKSLSEIHKIRHLGNLPVWQKVERWFSQPSGHNLTARELAAEIEVGSHFCFNRIAFKDIVHASLRYPAPSVEWFLQQHRALYSLLKEYLSVNKNKTPLYIEVEEDLRRQSLFAHRALVQCLLEVGYSVNPVSTSTSLSFKYIAGPIQRLFKDYN